MPNRHQGRLPVGALPELGNRRPPSSPETRSKGKASAGVPVVYGLCVDKTTMTDNRADHKQKSGKIQAVLLLRSVRGRAEPHQGRHGPLVWLMPAGLWFVCLARFGGSSTVPRPLCRVPLCPAYWACLLSLPTLARHSGTAGCVDGIFVHILRHENGLGGGQEPPHEGATVCGPGTRFGGGRDVLLLDRAGRVPRVHGQHRRTRLWASLSLRGRLSGSRARWRHRCPRYCTESSVQHCRDEPLAGSRGQTLGVPDAFG